MYFGDSIAKSAPALRINLTEQFTVLILTHLLDPLTTEALAGIVGDEEEAGVVVEEVAEAVEVLQTVGEEVVVAKALNKELQMPTVVVAVADGLTESS